MNASWPGCRLSRRGRGPVRQQGRSRPATVPRPRRLGAHRQSTEAFHDHPGRDHPGRDQPGRAHPGRCRQFPPWRVVAAVGCRSSASPALPPARLSGRGGGRFRVAGVGFLGSGGGAPSCLSPVPAPGCTPGGRGAGGAGRPRPDNAGPGDPSGAASPTQCARPPSSPWPYCTSSGLGAWSVPLWLS